MATRSGTPAEGGTESPEKFTFNKTKLSSSPYEAMIAKSPAPTETQCLLAVPKKGRLAATVMEILDGAGLQHVRPNRLDVAKCKRLPVSIVFLPAADIARYVGEGNVDIGITGLDIIEESGSEVEVLCPLNIGKCKLAVQAPVGSVKDVSELAGKRIVTSFPNLTRKFFDKLDSSEETSVKYVSGSVEVACALGLADGIVDLVETGTTMRAAGLEMVTTVMETETVLIKNKSTKNEALVARILKRIQGYLLSCQNSMLTYNIPRSALPEAEQITPGAQSPTVSPLEDGSWVAVTVLVQTDEISDIMDRLQAIGAQSLIVYDISNCRM